MQQSPPDNLNDDAPFSGLIHDGWKFIIAYPYTNENDDLLYENCRFERGANGDWSKTFRQRRPNGSGFVYSLDGVRQVPYRLHELIECPGQDVHLAEGEKDADTLAALGLCSTSIASANNVELEAFRDRNVFIHEDNDAAGRRQAMERAAALSEVAASVRIVHYLDAGDGGDVSDWLPQDRGLEYFLERCEEAEEFHLAHQEQAECCERTSNRSRPALNRGAPSKRETAFAQTALDNICAELHAMPRDSGRNDALNRGAYRLGRMAARGWIDEQAVFHELREACRTNGLMGDDPRAVERTIESGWQAGLRDPHPDLEDRPYNRSADYGAPHNGAPVNGDARPRAEIRDDVEDNDPLPLYRRVSQDDDFPIEALGDDLAEAVMALKAATQTPVEMAANSILGAISFACQARADIQLPIAAGPSPLSLYLLTIAKSGERKSTNDKIALKAVDLYQEELRKDYRKDYQAYVDRLDIWKAARAKIIGDKKGRASMKQAELDQLGEEPEPPLSPLLIFNDPTIQAIIKQFRDHQPSLGLFSAEGAVLLNGYAFAKEQKLNSGALLSLLWDGRGITNIRAGDGETNIPGRRLTIHLAAQRKVAANFLNDEELRDQGLTSRFLVADAESTMGSRFYAELSHDDEAALMEFQENLLKILRRALPLKEGTRNELAPPALTMGDETREMWIEFYNDVERKLAPDGEYEPISGIACKLPENAARLAACIAMYAKPDEAVTEVDIDSFRQGIELARYYARTALRLVDAEEPERELTEAAKLLVWLKTNWISAGEAHKKVTTWAPGHECLVSLPDITQYGPHCIRKTATARHAMRVLEEHRHVKVGHAQVVRGKSRKEVWRIFRDPETSNSG